MESTRKESILSPISYKQVNIVTGLNEANINLPPNKLPLLPMERLEEKQHCETNSNHHQQQQDNHWSTRLL